METEKPKQKKKTERVRLDSISQQIIEGWINQIEIKRPGIQVSRTAIVNWLISNSPPKLSGRQLKSLEQAFFDEEKAAKWLLQEIRKAKAEGRSTTIETILNSKAKPN